MWKKPIFLVLLLIMVIVILLHTEIMNYFTARQFLNDVEKGEFEKAFRYVDYYDIGDDVKPKISYDGAKSIWISRMAALKKRWDLFI